MRVGYISLCIAGSFISISASGCFRFSRDVNLSNVVVEHEYRASNLELLHSHFKES